MKMQVSQLKINYGQVSVIKGINLGLPDRSVTALIGPSGCGKSTLLRAFNRMHDLNPQVRVSGRITLDGRDIDRMAPQEVRCRVGMLFQRPNPFPFSIYQNVAFGPSLFGVRKPELEQIVAHSLEGAALWAEVRHRLHADARTLSGGQQQRLCLARALAVQPEVLLMDEPCSALDPGATQAIEQLIGNLRQEMAVAIVTHSMAQARRVADRVAFLYAGRLVEEGSVEQVLDHPREPETAQFMAQ